MVHVYNIWYIVDSVNQIRIQSSIGFCGADELQTFQCLTILWIMQQNELKHFLGISPLSSTCKDPGLEEQGSFVLGLKGENDLEILQGRGPLLQTMPTTSPQKQLAFHIILYCIIAIVSFCRLTYRFEIQRVAL